MKKIWVSALVLTFTLTSSLPALASGPSEEVFPKSENLDVEATGQALFLTLKGAALGTWHLVRTSSLTENAVTLAPFPPAARAEAEKLGLLRKGLRNVNHEYENKIATAELAHAKATSLDQVNHAYIEKVTLKLDLREKRDLFESQISKAEKKVATLTSANDRWFYRALRKGNAAIPLTLLAADTVWTGINLLEGRESGVDPFITYAVSSVSQAFESSARNKPELLHSVENIGLPRASASIDKSSVSAR